jgi:hypothetical protein
LREHIRARVALREEQLSMRRLAGGRTVLGADAVRRQSIEDKPHRGPDGFGTRPRVSTRSLETKVEAVQRNREWIDHYREALTDFVDHRGDAVFPFGTYAMRVRFGAPCEPLGGAAGSDDERSPPSRDPHCPTAEADERARDEDRRDKKR